MTLIIDWRGQPVNLPIGEDREVLYPFEETDEN